MCGSGELHCLMIKLLNPEVNPFASNPDFVTCKGPNNLVHPCSLISTFVIGFLVKYTEKSILSRHSKRRQKIGFQDRLLLDAGQKYYRMLQESIL